jgi:hypothetical protein
VDIGYEGRGRGARPAIEVLGPSKVRFATRIRMAFGDSRSTGGEYRLDLLCASRGGCFSPTCQDSQRSERQREWTRCLPLWTMRTDVPAHDPLLEAEPLRQFLLECIAGMRDVELFRQKLHAKPLQSDEREDASDPLGCIRRVATGVIAEMEVVVGIRRDSPAVSPLNDAPLHSEFRRSLRDMPQLEAMALILHFQEGLSAAAIEERIGLSYDSGERHLVRAKARPRTLLFRRHDASDQRAENKVRPILR